MTSPLFQRRVVIGLDFGTLSGRAVVVAVDDGAELGSAVHEYSHGVITDVLPGDRTAPATGLGVAGAVGLCRSTPTWPAGGCRCWPRRRVRRWVRRSTPGSPPSRTRTSTPPRRRWATSTPRAYTPDEGRARACDALYARYSILHDYFGRGANEVMHRLRDIKREAVS